MTNIFLKLIIKFIKNIRWRRLILFVLILSLGLLTVQGVKNVGNPAVCNQCHSMGTYYTSWQKSTHSKVQCYFCHSGYKDRGMVSTLNNQPTRRILITTNKAIILFGKSVDYISKKTDTTVFYLENKLQIFQMFYNMAKGQSTRSVNSATWQNCFKCHQDLISSSENDYFGHFKHAQAGLSKCNQCHNNLVHGQQKKIRWQLCSGCHQNESPRPASHDSSTFQTSHGRDYLKNKNCELCHPGGVKQKLCMDCHQTVMPHPQNFKIQHISQIEKIGVRNCMTCHQNKADEEPRNSTACETCHRREMPHTKNVLRTHTSLVKELGIKACYYCHQTRPDQKDMATACISCHQVDMPHPANFKSIHPPVALAKGVQTCYFCHSPKNPANPMAMWASPQFCLNCHKQQKPHTPDWRLQHQLANNDPNRCLFCHPEINHCQGCHYEE